MASVNGEEQKNRAASSSKKRATSSRQSQRSKKSSGRSARGSIGSVGAESISERIPESPSHEEIEPEPTNVPEPEEPKTEEDPTRVLVSDKRIFVLSRFCIVTFDDLSSFDVIN